MLPRSIDVNHSEAHLTGAKIDNPKAFRFRKRNLRFLKKVLIFLKWSCTIDLYRREGVTKIWKK